MISGFLLCHRRDGWLHLFKHIKYRESHLPWSASLLSCTVFKSKVRPSSRVLMQRRRRRRRWWWDDFCCFLLGAFCAASMRVRGNHFTDVTFLDPGHFMTTAHLFLLPPHHHRHVVDGVPWFDILSVLLPPSWLQVCVVVAARRWHSKKYRIWNLACLK